MIKSKRVLLSAKRAAVGGTTSVSSQKITQLGSPNPQTLPPITLAEKLGASLLMLATLAVGLYPKLLLDRIMPAVEAMRFLTK